MLGIRFVGALIMASVYMLAKDKLEQVRAVLAADAVYDAEADHLLALTIRRLGELDDLAVTGLAPEPRDVHRHNHALMPWLDR